MTLSELRLAVASVTNPRSRMPPSNVIAFSKVAQFVSDENPCVNQKREVRVTTFEEAKPANDTFKADSTAPMGFAMASPVVASPAKRRATALLLASTIGEPESPDAANAGEGAVGDTTTWLVKVAMVQVAPSYMILTVALTALTVPSVQAVVRPFFWTTWPMNAGTTLFTWGPKLRMSEETSASELSTKPPSTRLSPPEKSIGTNRLNVPTS